MTPPVAPDRAAEDWRHGGFGLYLHWPYCQSKCPYCDFNSHVAASIDQGRWQAAYLREIGRIGGQTGGRVLHSVFFGGGTPSLMEPVVVRAVLDRIRATWPVANDLEVTLEANPGSVEMARFSGYAEAGVNRISIGVQSLDDVALQKLGRQHTSAEARRAVGIAQSVFDRVSIDLIYARQDQTRKGWEDELTAALDLGTDHLSLYQLTIEDGTVFARRQAERRLPGLPDEDLAAEMFETTRTLCSEAGLAAYEVSNHARPGAESRHNLIYWRMGDYAGIGPGAHGRLTLGGQRFATEAVRAPDDWLNRTEGEGSGELPRLVLAPEERAVEYLMMALRLEEGASLQRFRALSGIDLAPDAIADVHGLGFVTVEGDRLRATPKGVLLLNGVLRALLVDRASAGQ